MLSLGTMNETTGERIKRLRTERGWSLRKLAGNAGIAHTGLLRVERGDYLPTAAAFEGLAIALNVSMDWLAGRTEVKGVAQPGMGWDGGFRRR